MARVLLPLAEGFEELEAITIVDVLRRGGVEVVVAALGESLSVKGAHALAVTADALLADVAEEEYAAIVLPGGGLGTENLRRSELLIRRLRRQREEHRLLAAICAAPTVLVAAEVLDPETHVTCYPSCQGELARPWAPAPVVEDGLVITGQAPGSALLFALVVLKTLAGEPVAAKVADGMVTDVFS